MTLPRANLKIALACCALAAGCQAPWAAPFSRPDSPARTAATSTAAKPAAVHPPTPSVDATDPADLAGVLDKLAQVRALDPAAESRLLDQLRKTPPDQWPLVAEQFRATLALHQQLVADDLPASNAALAGTRSRSIAEKPVHASTPIGALVDPHLASADPVDVLAQSITSAPRPPLNDAPEPSADSPMPAEFAISGPAYPINSRDTAVKPAAFEVPAATAAQTAPPPLTTADANPSMQTYGPELVPSARQEKQLAPSSAADDDWQRLVHKAADDLSHRVVASPASTAEVHQHVSLRLLRLLAGDTEKALEPIPHISPAEQDYWSRQIFALATYLDHHSQPDDKRRAASSVAHLDEAVSHLRELGSLSLRNLSFCKNVYGYGTIETYDNDTFTAGQQVSLYVEVENYHSKSTEKGFCTLLGATYEILDDKSRRVAGGEFPDVDDCCRSRRRDFHIQFGLSLPENLTPGRYRVELVVKDRQSDKLGHATAPFELRSGKK